MQYQFQEFPGLKPDPIMAAKQAWPAFEAEHPNAVNTTIGELIDDETGSQWQPQSVWAPRRNALIDSIRQHRFGYQGQRGHEPYVEQMGLLLLGEEGYAQQAGDLWGYQTDGGTNALFLAKMTVENAIMQQNGRIPMVLDAGWPNHPNIFRAPFDISTYPHLDFTNGTYNHQRALDAIEKSPKQSALLLQSDCYNDDGTGRSPEQWSEIFDVADARDSVIIFDAAYLGLANGFEQDRVPLLECVKRGFLTFACLSSSKNMGVYGERLGATFILNARRHMDAQKFAELDGIARAAVRGTISSPHVVAAEGAAVALRDPRYHKDLEIARDNLNAKRALFGAIVAERFPYVRNGQGLFTRLLETGFTPDQRAYLDDQGIFTLQSSRVNFGSILTNDVERTADTIMDAPGIR